MAFNMTNLLISLAERSDSQERRLRGREVTARHVEGDDDDDNDNDDDGDESRRVLTPQEMELLFGKQIDSANVSRRPIPVLLLNDSFYDDNEDLITLDVVGNNNNNHHHQPPKLIIKPEEVAIVVLVLLIWVGVILLFIRSWGKIRGLEPYTPSFDRNSSPMMPLSSGRTSSRLQPRPTGRGPPCHRQGRLNRYHDEQKTTLKPHLGNRVNFDQHEQETVFQFPPSSRRLIKSSVNINDHVPRFCNQPSLPFIPYQVPVPKGRCTSRSEPDIRLTPIHPVVSSKLAKVIYKPPHHVRRCLDDDWTQTSLD